MKKAFLILIFITVSCYGISQVWVPLYAGSSMMVDADGLKNHMDYLQFQNGYEIKTSDWNGYLKKLCSTVSCSYGRFNSGWFNKRLLRI